MGADSHGMMGEMELVKAEVDFCRLGAVGLDTEDLSREFGARGNLPARWQRHVLHNARSDPLPGVDFSWIEGRIQPRRQNRSRGDGTLRKNPAREQHGHSQKHQLHLHRLTAGGAYR